MRFLPTPLAGAYIVFSDAREDERGSFYRTFCRDEFEANGLRGDFVQASLSRNHTRGTLRGMHFQTEPRTEHKLVRCIRGAAFDAVIDLRLNSPTYCDWFGVELSESNRNALYIPSGFAHGFLSLHDGTDMLYQMTECYVPEFATGVRWNDPAFGIVWPLDPILMSARDRSYADIRPTEGVDKC